MWPITIAPYQVIITPVNVNDESIRNIAEKLYDSLLEKGVDVIIDDRDERAGVKFNDADLIGIPLRAIIGKKALSEGKIEVKIRKSGEVIILETDEVVDFIFRYINEGMQCP
jgi:prolyl-tRNA synthetase